MKIELKNIKHARFLSRETEAFSATIYIEGLKAATVENDGGGGANLYRFSDRALEQKFHEHCKSLPPLQSEHGPLSMDADLFLGELMEQQEMARHCKKKTLFRIPGDPDDGTYRSVSAPFTKALKEHLVRKYGEDITILNETLGQVAQ